MGGLAGAVAATPTRLAGRGRVVIASRRDLVRGRRFAGRRDPVAGAGSRSRVLTGGSRLGGSRRRGTAQPVGAARVAIVARRGLSIQIQDRLGAGGEGLLDGPARMGRN